MAEQDPRTVHDLAPGAHVFVPYNSEEEAVTATAESTRLALDAGVRCICSCGKIVGGRCAGRWRKKESPYIVLANQRILAWTDRSMFLRDHEFDTEGFAERLEAETEGARSSNHEGLWLINDMAWAVGSAAQP